MLRVFGGVALEVDGVEVPLRAQQRQLLGVLLAERDRALPTDVLVDRLWGDSPPKTAAKIVHIVVGQLRQALAGDEPPHAIVRGDDGYRLEPGDLDLDHYEHELERVDRLAVTDPAAALEAVERALGWWRGHPWGEQADEQWLLGRVTVLEERHRHAEELWAELVLRCSSDRLPLDRFRAAVLGAPLREQRWGHLMVALYRMGRQADAIRTYDELRERLLEELGIDPSPELRNLHLAILQQDDSLAATSLVHGAAANSFVGRTRDLERLDEALAHNRVVTLVGLGGIGKSRLASEYSHRRRLAGAPMQWATLGSLPDPDEAAAYVAEAIGAVDDASSPTLAVAASIGVQPLLLVVDGAEVAPSRVATMVLQLLEQCPRLRVLLTSRIPIGLAGETTITLEPLPLPSTGGSVRGTALELAMNRAGVDGVALDDTLRSRLTELCEAAGGVPLLIELLAHSVDAVAPPRTTHTETTPTGTVRTETMTAHREAVRDAIASAMAEAGEPARRLVRSMAPLPAGVSEQTAAALIGVDPREAGRCLRLLARVHLVGARPGSATLRYRSLDPVREVLSGELPADAARADLVRLSDALRDDLLGLRPPGRGVIVGRLDAIEDEHDNLRYALGEWLRTEPEQALALAIPACEFWPVRGHIVEGRRWLQSGIDAAAPEGELRWRGVIALARTTRTFAEVTEMHDELANVVDEARADGADEVLVATGLLYLAMAAGWRGDSAGAARALADVREIDARVGTPWTTAQIDHLDALSLALGGNLDAAREGQRRFARRMEELDDPVGAAMGWYLAATLGDMAQRTDLRDDIDRARALAQSHRDVALLGQILRLEARLLGRLGDPAGPKLLEEAAQRLAEQGGLRAAALARLDLALHALDAGRSNQAIEQLRRSLPALRALDPAAAALGCAALAAITAAGGDASLAARLASATMVLRGRGDHGDTDVTRIEAFLDGIAPADAPIDDRGVAELLDAALA